MKFSVLFLLTTFFGSFGLVITFFRVQKENFMQGKKRFCFFLFLCIQLVINFDLRELDFHLVEKLALRLPNRKEFQNNGMFLLLRFLERHQFYWRGCYVIVQRVKILKH